MKTTLLFVGLFITTLYTSAQEPTLQWAKSLGGVSNDVGESIRVDAAGNVYTVGYFTGTADFDPNEGIFNLSSVSSRDTYISKLDVAGNFVWAKSIGAGLTDYGQLMEIDASGNIYFAGYFYGTTDFDPNAGVYNLTTSGSSDIYICKLTSLGNFVWAKNMGGSDYDFPNSLALDTEGNIYTTGYFMETADFDPNAGTENLTSVGDADIFISKLDSSGNFVWAKSMGGKSYEEGISIEVDISGSVYSAGRFNDSTDFDPSAETTILVPVGGFDIYISKLDSAGNFVWAKNIGGLSSEFENSITVDASGNVYTTGAFNDIVDFDPNEGTYILESGGSSSYDVFISKLDASGNFVWAKNLGGPGSEMGYSITVDASANVYTTGSFTGIADFDPNAGIYNLNSAGDKDIFISKLDASGNFVWAKSMGGGLEDIGKSIVVDASYKVYTTGSYQGTADLDPSEGILNFTSAGEIDTFIHKMFQGTLSINEISSEFSIYPNPSKGEITIKLSDNIGNCTLRVNNLLGEVLHSEIVSGQSTNLNLDLKKGLYFISLYNNGQASTRKMIVE